MLIEYEHYTNPKTPKYIILLKRRQHDILNLLAHVGNGKGVKKASFDEKQDKKHAPKK
jgi:hypothetical protein